MPSGAGAAGSVELKKRMLLKQKETLMREQEYKTKAELYRQRLTQDLTRVLPWDNPTIAAAELQKLLKEIADRNGVEIIRKDVQQEKKVVQENLVKVSVKIETNCVPDQLVQFLAAVENYEKSLSVDELVINSFRIQKKYEIRPIITVSGYIVAPPAAPAPKAIGRIARLKKARLYMSKNLIAANILLLVVAGLLGWQLRVSIRRFNAENDISRIQPVRDPKSLTPEPGLPVPKPRRQYNAGEFDAVAAQNLFSETRAREEKVEVAAVPESPPLDVKPVLVGNHGQRVAAPSPDRRSLERLAAGPQNPAQEAGRQLPGLHDHRHCDESDGAATG